MAKIQLMQEQQRIQPRNPVPVASSSRARIGAESQQAIGKGLMNLAGNIGQIEAEHNRKRKQAEAMKAKTAVDALSRNAYQDAIMNAKADGSDIRSLYLDSVNSGRAEILNGLDESVAEKVEQYSFGVDGQADKMLFNKSIRMAEKDIIRTYDEAANMKEALIMKDPELAAKYASAFELDAFSSTPEGGTPALMAELKPAYENKFANAMLNGFYTKGKHSQVFLKKGLALLDASTEDAKLKSNTVLEYSPGEAASKGLIDQEEADKLRASGEKYKIETQDLSSSDGADGLSNMLLSLDGKQRAAWVNRFQSAIKEKAASGINELNLRKGTVDALLKKVSSYDDLKQVEPFAQKVTSEIMALPNTVMSPSMKFKNVAGLQTKMAAANKAVDMRNVNRHEIPGMIENSSDELDAVISETLAMTGANDDGLLKLRMKDLYKTELDGHHAQMLKDEKDDAYGALKKTHGAVVEALEVAAKNGGPEEKLALSNFVDDYYERRGTPVAIRRSMTVNDSLKKGMEFTAAISAGAGSQELDDFQKSEGLLFREKMANMVKDGTVPAGVMVAATLADPNSRNKVMGLYTDAKEIEKDFSNSTKSSKAELDSAVSKVMDKMSVSIHQHSQGGSKYVNGFTDLVKIETQRRFLKGAKNIDVAAKEAYDSILGSSFQEVNGFNSTLMLPKNDRFGNEINTGPVEDFFRAYKKVNNLKTLEPDIASVYPAIAKQMSESKVPHYKARLYNDFLADIRDHGKWKKVPSENAMVLTLEGRELMNTSGRPIKKNFDGIADDYIVINDQKSGWSKYTELVSDYTTDQAEQMRQLSDEKRWAEYYKPSGR